MKEFKAGKCKQTKIKNKYILRILLLPAKLKAEKKLLLSGQMKHLSFRRKYFLCFCDFSGGNKGGFVKNRNKLQNQQYKVLYCTHLDINWSAEVIECIR